MNVWCVKPEYTHYTCSNVDNKNINLIVNRYITVAMQVDFYSQ